MRHGTTSCIAGTLTADPSLTVTDVGRYRFEVRFELDRRPGGRHRAVSAHEPDLLVIVGPLAEVAYTQFTRDDRFLAVGTVQWQPVVPIEDAARRTVFFATSLGHDLGQHRYAVDRTRRGGRRSRRPSPDRTWGEGLLFAPIEPTGAAS